MTAARIGARLAIGGAVSVVALVLLAAPAGAHTELASSSPAAGSTVDRLDRLDLHFTEPIEISASHVWITDVAGSLELAGLSQIDGDATTLTVPVPPLGEGAYEVTWHVLALDGDPVQGSFPLTVEGAPPSSTATTLDPAADYPPDTSLAIPLDSIRGVGSPPEGGGHGHGPSELTKGLARGVLDASLAVLVGGLAFVALVWPGGAGLLRTRQVLWGAGGLAAIASLELTAFQHAGVKGMSPYAALAPSHQLGALDFHFGRVGAVRVLLIGGVLALVAMVVRRSNRPLPSRMWIAVAVGLAVALAETMVLLGQSVSLVSVKGMARFTHVIGISAWIGGLVMLLAVALPRRRPAELLALLPRFSAFATTAVVALVVGGVALSVDHLGRAGALTSTDYGRVLLAKLVVVGLALTVAALCRAHVRSCLEAPAGIAGAAVARPLVVWAGIEVGLLAAVLGITTVLVAGAPPA